MTKKDEIRYDFCKFIVKFFGTAMIMIGAIFYGFLQANNNNPTFSSYTIVFIIILLGITSTGFGIGAVYAMWKLHEIYQKLTR